MYRPVVNDLLGLPHTNIPIQLDLWGREAVFMRKRTDNHLRTPKAEMNSKGDKTNINPMIF